VGDPDPGGGCGPTYVVANLVYKLGRGGSPSGGGIGVRWWGFEGSVQSMFYVDVMDVPIDVMWWMQWWFIYCDICMFVIYWSMMYNANKCLD